MPSERLLPAVREALGDRYTIERFLAVGGAACVFRARDTSGRPVALKVLHPELYVTITADRFREEVRIMSQLDHPRIAAVLDFGEKDWFAYYVMAYVTGSDLARYLDHGRRMTINDTLHIADQVLDGLAYAHSQKVIHRDIKPSNLMVSHNGIVLLDFGIARALVDASRKGLTAEGSTVGTAHYMSPEQVRGDNDIDERTDLYSLGCVLFECVAGKPPFSYKDDTRVRASHLESTPQDLSLLRPEAPKDLITLINLALNKDRSQRWQSAIQMRSALHRLHMAAKH